MNKKLLLTTLVGITAGLAFYAQAAFLDLKVQIGVSTCTGANAQCNVTINAIGDVIEVDIKGAPIEDLGTLNEEKTINLTLPQKPGTHTVYSFTPSTGELANTKIYLLVQNEEQRRGTRRADMQVFKFSRQLPGDKPDQWIEVGTLEAPKTTELAEYPFMVETDGTFVAFDTKNAQGTETVEVDTTKPLPQGINKVRIAAGQKDIVG